MTTTTFIADGKTKIFYFRFPFFVKSDVIIEVDSRPATNYNLICIKNGLNPDIPFSGGEVHFNKSPKIASVITIKRKLAVKRIVDYQQTAKYDPCIHNQDMNYVLEILNDMQTALDKFAIKYADITTQDTNDITSQRIEQILVTIDELREIINQPTDPIDLSGINASIENLTTAINTLNTRTDDVTTSISTLNSKCNNMVAQIENIENSLPDGADYVVAWQNPTAANNYTWYRKYKSGWVEQGGVFKDTFSGYTTKTVSLPVKMADTKYCAHIADYASGTNYTPQISGKTTTSITFSNLLNTTANGANWTVCGKSA